MSEDSNFKNNVMENYKGIHYILFVICWYNDDNSIHIKSALTSDFQAIRLKAEDCGDNYDFIECIWPKISDIWQVVTQGGYAWNLETETFFQIGDFENGYLENAHEASDEEAFDHYDIRLFSNYQAVLEAESKDYSNVEDVISFKYDCFDNDKNWLNALFLNSSLPPAFINLVLYDQDSEIHHYALEHLKLYPAKKALIDALEG